MAVAIFFSWEYFSLLKLSREIASDLGKARLEVSQLQRQLGSQVASNERLRQERIILERELASTQEDIVRSRRAIDRLEQDLDSLKIHVGSLERNNALLRSRIDNLALAKKRLEIQIEGLIRAKKNLKERFYGLDDEGDDSSFGNRGYLIRRGATTYKPNINIRVLPAP